MTSSSSAGRCRFDMVVAAQDAEVLFGACRSLRLSALSLIHQAPACGRIGCVARRALSLSSQRRKQGQPACNLYNTHPILVRLASF